MLNNKYVYVEKLSQKETTTLLIKERKAKKKEREK